MNKIFNWTFGSIFRTIGRIIAYLIIGFILFSFINFDKIKDDIKKGISLDSWVGIPKTYASVITENVKYYDTQYISIDQSSGGWTNSNGMFYQTISTNSSEQIKSLSIGGVSTTNADYVQLTFSASQPTDRTTNSTPSSNLQDHYCSKWTCNQYCATGSCAGMCEVYQCSTYSSRDMGGQEQYITTSQEITPLNFIITANYSGGWSTCQIEGNSIMCPTLKRQITSIDFHINFNDTRETFNFQLMVHRSLTMYQYSDDLIINNQNTNTQNIINNQNTNNQNIINNQNQNAQNLNSTLTDDSLPSNMSGLDNSYLSGLLPPGPLDSVINIPLSIMNTIVNTLSGTCSPIVIELPFIHENLTIPCISTIFSNITGLIDFYNGVGVIASAFILYKYLCYLYYWFDDVSSMKNLKPRLFGVSSNAEYWGGD